MIWCAVLTIVVLGLLFSGLFSGAETGLYRANRLRLDLAVQQNDPRATRLLHVIDDRQGALAVFLIGTNLMNYLTTAATAFLFIELLRVNDVDAEIYTVALLTPLVFVFGEVVPKNLFRLYADTLMLRAHFLLAFFDRVFRWTGLVWGLKTVLRGVDHLFGSPTGGEAMVAPKWRMAMLLQEALTAQALDEAHSDLVDRVCQLSETPLHRVMVPRNRVVMIAARADRQTLMRIARKTTHARLPVYETRTKYVTGIVNVDELLQRQDWTAVGECGQPVPALSPHETGASAINRLRAAGRKTAVVTDHGGRMLGIVTLNDLLEQVVGELDPGPAGASVRLKDTTTQ